MLVRIGYGTKKMAGPTMIKNIKDLEQAKSALIASSVGAKKTLRIAEQAKKRGVKILNMKKVRRAERIVKAIQKKKEAAGKSKVEEKTGVEEKKTDKEAEAVVKENPTAI